MSDEPIHINIWDDYCDDGFVPEGDVQETHAYLEGGNLSDADSRAVLLLLQQTVERIRHADSTLTCKVEWYDSALVYPNLVGTEFERHLYKRWQLQMTHLPHSERVRVVAELNRLPLQYNGRRIVVYSES